MYSHQLTAIRLQTGVSILLTFLQLPLVTSEAVTGKRVSFLPA